MEVARAMLHDQTLSKFLWGEAKHAAHRVPNQALENKTLEEVFTGFKLDISYLRIFGCPIYFHVPKYKRNKLEVIGRKGTFLGYCGNSKVYKVEIIRDLTFDEYDCLGKEKDLPPPAPHEKRNDERDILDGPFTSES